MKYVAAMNLTLGAAIAATAIMATAGTSTAADTTPKPVTHPRYDSVHEWTIKSHVDLVFRLSGHFVKKWTDAEGQKFRMKAYPAIDGGRITVTFIDNVSTGADGVTSDYGYALWSKTWCTADGTCTTVDPV